MTEVAVGIILKDGRVLLCQRKASARYPLKWEFPGGKAELNESSEDCLRREVFEELGIHVGTNTLFHHHHHVYPDKASFNIYYYIVKDISGTIKDNAFARLQWVPLNRLSSFDILEGNNEVVDKLIRQYGTH